MRGWRTASHLASIGVCPLLLPPSVYCVGCSLDVALRYDMNDCIYLVKQLHFPPSRFLVV